MMHATNSDMIPVREMTASEILKAARERKMRFEAQARAQRRREEEQAKLKRLKAEYEAHMNSEELKRQQEISKLRRKEERERENEKRLKKWLAEQRTKQAEDIVRMRQELGIGYRASFTCIVRRMAKGHKVSPNDIFSHRRAKHIVLARQGVMYWACRLTPLSLPHIARLLGGFDHSSVHYGSKAYPEKRKKAGRNLRVIR